MRLRKNLYSRGYFLWEMEMLITKYKNLSSNENFRKKYFLNLKAGCVNLELKRDLGNQ